MKSFRVLILLSLALSSSTVSSNCDLICRSKEILGVHCEQFSDPADSAPMDLFLNCFSELTFPSLTTPEMRLLKRMEGCIVSSSTGDIQRIIKGCVDNFKRELSKQARTRSRLMKCIDRSTVGGHFFYEDCLQRQVRKCRRNNLRYLQCIGQKDSNQ